MIFASQEMNFNPISDESLEEVLNPKQAFFVFQFAHSQTALRSQDRRPWIRCIGFTQTLDEARTLAKSAFDAGDKMETRIMPAGRVFLGGRLKYKDLDLPRREEEQQKANALVDEWIAAREKIHKETEALATSKTVLPEPTFAEEAASTSCNAKGAGAGEDEGLANAVLNLVPQTVETVSVPFQSLWACAVIPDSSKLNEPAIIPLFASPSLETIQAQVKRACKCKDLVHFDVHIGHTGIWLPLNDMEAEQVFHHHPLRQVTEKTLRRARK